MLHDILSECVASGGIIPAFESLLLMEPLAFHRVFTVGGGRIDIPAMTAGPAADAAKADLPIRVVGSTAIIPVVGMTNKRMRANGFLASYVATSAALEAAVADPKIDGIMLKIDSPGGFVTGIAEAADDIRKAASRKRVVAQVDGLAASAAYWMASQANEVYAGRMDDVGSIGVLAVLYDVSKADEKAGVKTEVFSTGKYKWTGVLGTAITPEQREYVQSLVDKAGDAFVADVARGRRMAEADVRKVADGRVWHGAEAQARGLIDGVRTYPETLSLMRDSSVRDRRLTAARLGVARGEQKIS